MGSDDLFKKRRVERNKRKENIRKQKSSNWLIVCEGKETEPNYFEGAVAAINELIEDAYKLKVKIVGKGMNTTSLVKSTQDILNEIDEYKIILSHRPLEDRGIPDGYINIHGHIHNAKLDDSFDSNKHKCVSVEVINYKPIEIENVKKEG